MMASEPDVKAEELAAVINQIRDRVRARYPEGEARGLGVALPDLLPVLHARDAAESKVAAIGSVNPRPAGVVNSAIQWAKRNIARSLGWFVRDQVEYNRAMLLALEATLESLNQVNRTFVAVGNRIDELRHDGAGLRAEASELKDIRSHWIQWREEWQKKLYQNEIHFLRSVADLQASFEGKVLRAEDGMRETTLRQHALFEAALAKAIEDVHARFWKDLEKVRLEYEALIHSELRVVRQKAFSSAASASGASVPAAGGSVDFDYARFADRFRGSEEYVRNGQRFYLPYFAGRTNVLDIGCGRGEFLDLMRESGVGARGVDLDAESVALCRSKGLEAEAADVFELFDREPDGVFDGIFAAQVIEHMAPERVPQLIKACAAKLKQGGVLALETPNPECLAIFATHFYLDPTHTRPIPPGLAAFYFEEFGFGRIEVHRLSPAVESMPSVGELPEAFREAFFGGLDYCVIGRRL